MEKNNIVIVAFGAFVRYFLASSKFGAVIANRVEVSTPLNSFNRVQEGVFLYKNGIDPYTGDMVHEAPLLLAALSKLPLPQAAPLLYTILDLLTAAVLYKLSQYFIRTKLELQKAEFSSYAAGTEELQLHNSDIKSIPQLVMAIYLCNPLSILNCAGLTSTVFSNLLLAGFFHALTKRTLLPCLLFLALETTRSLYPMVLIAPVLLVFGKTSIVKCTRLVAYFAITCIAVLWLNALIVDSWTFVDATLGFIFFYRDLQPNIGLFWYFFTEMFDHFRTMFLITFQMNATVLYLIPLTLKLRKDPVLLAMILVSLMAIFRSYPCIGDVGLYLSFLPLWRRCWKFMAHVFVVFCLFLVTITILPVLWHLWIYAGSANANFYFGATLAFAIGQIFLVTDLLFAYVKRDFCLQNGQRIFFNGKEAKIILQ